MKAVVWSKPACPYCEKAKNLLKMKGIEYEEKNIAEGYKIQDLYTTDFEQEDYIEVQVPGNAPININNNMEYGDKKTHWDVMFQMKNVVSVPVEVKYTKSGKSARNQITYIRLPNTVFLFQTLYPHN